jgi:hypothetical protein
MSKKLNHQKQSYTKKHRSNVKQDIVSDANEPSIAYGLVNQRELSKLRHELNKIRYKDSWKSKFIDDLLDKLDKE